MLEQLTKHYPIGAYYLSEKLWTPDGVRQFAETGSDFLVSVRPNQALTDLCKQHGIGIFSIGSFSMWWGGDGGNAGGYEAFFPLQTLDHAAGTLPSNPPVWGDYLVDEPNARDFAHIDRVVRRYRALFPDRIPFINLYPNYASIAGTPGEQVVSQLGTVSYAEHIERYLREIDLPYLCFDFYPFTGEAGGPFDRYLENLDIAADACRRSSRALWVIIQAGAWKPEEAISTFQLRWQVGLCLAYGARSLMHASYSKGWWDDSTACVNADGAKNPMYNDVATVNREVHAVGSDYLNYRSTGVSVCGDLSRAHPRIRVQLERQALRPNEQNLDPIAKISSDAAILTGTFRSTQGRFALLLVNTQDPWNAAASADVRLQPAVGFVILHQREHKEVLPVPAEGLTLHLASGDWAFVELLPGTANPPLYPAVSEPI